jgi:hypothetical protein
MGRRDGSCYDMRMDSGIDSVAPLRVSARPAALAVVAALLCLGTALPAAAAKPAKAEKPRLMLDTQITPFNPQIGDVGRFTFTAPGTPSQPQSLSSGFRFTPSGKADSQRSLSLGLSTRVTTPVVDRSQAAAPPAQFVIPSGYGVNLSVDWHGFGLSGGFDHAEPAVPTPLTMRMADTVNLGVSYGGNRWRTRLAGTAEQSQAVGLAPLSSVLTRSYSVELGGLYRVAPRLSVTGGLRYRIAPAPPTLLTPNRDDQAVYFGTRFAF